ncbi:hypothetical protein ABZZ36_40320 [Actinacidiphila glaucinigra]|uniref:hypothetical protein n=1 Tax=Actinacidiphila glaucinigra TaxID=235986 RepID=UPI0033A8A627
MEAIAGELLMALAGGTAGAAGQQAWMSLRDLVRRPTAPGTGPEGPGEIPSGREEFAALDEEAESAERALALRATYDDAFREHFAAWRRAAEGNVARTGGGNVDNSITGGRQGTVIMGRDFHGPITFNQP